MHFRITSHLIRKLYQAAEKCETPVGKEQSEDPAGALFAPRRLKRSPRKASIFPQRRLSTESEKDERKPH